MWFIYFICELHSLDPQIGITLTATTIGGSSRVPDMLIKLENVRLRQSRKRNPQVGVRQSMDLFTVKQRGPREG